MALETIYKPFAGVGKMYARRYGVAEALREVGNCSNLSISYEEDSREQTDFTKGGGGVYASIKRINAATASFTASSSRVAGARSTGAASQRAASAEPAAVMRQ